MIHFVSKKFDQQNVLLNWKLARSGFFRFLYRRYIYEVVQFIDFNPRSLPREMNTFFFTRASSCTIYITTQQKERFLWNRTNDVERRAPSFLYKMVDVRIHSGSCLSSRTLLSTTSFQTKFYHNIPLI